MTQSPVLVTRPGLPPTTWQVARDRIQRLGLGQLRHLLGVHDRPATLVVVGAHPDDETFGCGRLAELWSRTVGECVAVLATAGEACIDGVAPRPADIAAVRLAEWDRATARLGVAVRHLVGLPDGQVGRHQGELGRHLVTVLGSLGRPVLVAAPYRQDPHPDHRAAGRAAAAVADELGCALVEYPVWMTYWQQPSEVDLSRWCGLAVDQLADRAQAEATACFSSQLEPLLPHLGPVVPAELLDHQREQLLLLPQPTPNRRGRA